MLSLIFVILEGCSRGQRPRG